MQAKIDEYTPLEEIIKISVGTDHVLALRRDGKVYAWGRNTSGQLGIGNTEDSKYAKEVVTEEGIVLNNIVDISCGANTSTAIDKDGNVYVWGNGTNGEIGNNEFISKLIAVKANIKNVIKIETGEGNISALSTSGALYNWGKNTNGQNGINSVDNTSYPMKSALEVVEVSNGYAHSNLKKVDGKIYGAGSTENRKTWLDR